MRSLLSRQAKRMPLAFRRHSVMAELTDLNRLVQTVPRLLIRNIRVMPPLLKSRLIMALPARLHRPMAVRSVIRSLR